MAKITENDIVVFLQQKIDSLTAELKKTQDVMEALTGIAPVGTRLSTSPTKSSTAGRGKAKELKPAVASASEPLRKRAGRPKSVFSGSLEAPSAYAPKLKMESKVAFALSKTGPAFKEDVTRVLNDLEPEADPKKLDKDVTVKLSSLFKKGRINATREGRKYRYSL